MGIKKADNYSLRKLPAYFKIAEAMLKLHALGTDSCKPCGKQCNYFERRTVSCGHVSKLACPGSFRSVACAISNRATHCPIPSGNSSVFSAARTSVTWAKRYGVSVARGHFSLPRCRLGPCSCRLSCHPISRSNLFKEPGPKAVCTCNVMGQI